MSNRAKHVVTNDITKCSGCANARQSIVKVKSIERCAGCSAAQRPYTEDLVDAMYDICIESAYKLINSLLWLLADDHKAGDFRYDEWTYAKIDVILKYIAYVKRCKTKGITPMPLNNWLNKYEDQITHAVPIKLIDELKDIRKKLFEQNELDAEYGDPVAYRKESAHKRRLKKMQETQNSTSSNKNVSSSDNSPACM